MLSAPVTLSSAWANQHFPGEFTGAVSLPGQQSGPSLVFTREPLERFGIEMAAEGQQFLQLEALALSHPKTCARDGFVWQNPLSSSPDLVEAAALGVELRGVLQEVSALRCCKTNPIRLLHRLAEMWGLLVWNALSRAEAVMPVSTWQ